MQIYVAGPLFTPGDRAVVDEVSRGLRSAGYTCFVPHEHELASDEVVAEEIFRLDWAGLQSSDAMVAIVDGSDVDSGTAAEIGIFAALGRPVIGYATDLRVHRLGVVNQFIAGFLDTQGPLCRTVDEVVRRAQVIAASSTR